MQDDPTTDLTALISIRHYAEIRHWCMKFGCTEVELAEAIAISGYSPDKVRAFLAQRFTALPPGGLRFQGMKETHKRQAIGRAVPAVRDQCVVCCISLSDHE